MFRLRSKAYALFTLIGVLLLTGVTKSNAQAPTITQPYPFYLIPFYYSGTSIEGASSHPGAWTNNTGSTQVIDVSLYRVLVDDGTISVDGGSITPNSNCGHSPGAWSYWWDEEVDDQDTWETPSTPTLTISGHYHAVGFYNAAAVTRVQINNNPATITVTNKQWMIERQF